MKLVSYLQKNTKLSRRSITKLIDEWVIFLNKNIVESYTQKIEVWDTIAVKWKNYTIVQKDLQDNDSTNAKMLLFHKPLGYVVSKDDPHNTTIYEILPKKYHNWRYIGRLDKNSSGLLLLTDDSRLVHQYEHPKFNLQKEYIVLLEKILIQSDIDKILEWVYEWGDLLETVSIQKVHKKTKGKIGNTRYKIILNQWKKRHIRRIFTSLNNKVLSLQRIREGKFELGNLGVWEWRELTVK